MPRKNNRKSYIVGKPAAYYENDPGYSERKLKCVGCAFAGYGFVCKTSDGTCLKSIGDPQGLGRDARHF